MVAVRLRHPQGIATIQVPLGNDAFTVQDLQQEIYSVCGILPSQQDLKAGYPPRTLATIPELPLDSLGLVQGDQIIVNQKAGVQSPSTAPANTSSIEARTGRKAETSAVPPKDQSSASSDPNYVEVDGSFLVHRKVPDDNSCLFSSVALIFKQDISRAPEMRKIAADGIRSDPETYNEAILGLPPATYIQKILSPQVWGGAIELTVLSKHFHTEIASVDVETGRIDRFEPGGNVANRCIVIYSGIHYDAATLAPMHDAPAEWHQTLFPVANSDTSADPILAAAKALATKLREKKAFTNTATFSLKCEQCGKGLRGEKEARQHADATGHVNFGEY